MLLPSNVFSIDIVALAPFCIFLDTHMSVLQTYFPCTLVLAFLHLTSFYQLVKNLCCWTILSKADILIITFLWSEPIRQDLLSLFHFSTSYDSATLAYNSSTSAPCWPRKCIWSDSPLEQASLLSYHPEKKVSYTVKVFTLLQTHSSIAFTHRS